MLFPSLIQLLLILEKDFKITLTDLSQHISPEISLNYPILDYSAQIKGTGEPSTQPHLALLMLPTSRELEGFLQMEARSFHRATTYYVIWHQNLLVDENVVNLKLEPFENMIFLSQKNASEFVMNWYEPSCPREWKIRTGTKRADEIESYRDLFPSRKYEDLCGQVFKLGFLLDLGSSEAIYRDFGNGTKLLESTWMDIVNNVGQYLNFSIGFHPFPENAVQPMLESLGNESVDMGQVLLQRHERTRYINYGFIPFESHQQSIVFYSHLPRQEQHLWGIFRPFPVSIWLIILLSGLVTCILFKHMGVEPTYNQALLQCIGELAGKGFERRPREGNRLSQGIAISLWVLYANAITMFYGSLLISHLTAPKVVKPPLTWDELAHSDYEICYHYLSHVQSYFKLSQEPTMAAIWKKSQDENRCSAKEWQTQEKLEEIMSPILIGGVKRAYISPFPHVIIPRIYQTHYGGSLYTTSKTQADPQFFSLTFRKTLPFLKEYNERISILFEMGLTTKFLETKKRVLKELTKSQQAEFLEKMQMQSRLDVSPIGLKHIFGSLIVLVLGLSLSALTLVLELVQHHYHYQH